MKPQALGLRGALWIATGLAGCSSVRTPEEVPELVARSADGVRLAYEVHGTGDPTLVFVHGWCCDRRFWKEQLDEFSVARRVVALDLAGHGRSGVERERWTLDALSQDVAAVVEQIGAQRVILVGHSMGAPVALLAAARLHGYVLGVIGVDTLHDADFRYPPGFLEQVARSFEADFPRAMESSIRSALPATVEPALARWILERACQTDRESAVALLRGLQDFDLRAVLAGAAVPVRVINAVPRPPEFLATDVAGNRRYADFDAVLLEGVGHFPMLERPAAFDRQMRRFLEELESRPPAP